MLNKIQCKRYFFYYKSYYCFLDRRVQPTVMEQSVESVMCASERVTDAPDAPEMVRRARLLGQATARLIADIKVSAASPRVPGL